MKLFGKDGLKVAIVAIVVLIVVFVLVDVFVMGAFDLTAKLQEENSKLNERMTNLVQVHQKTKEVFIQQQAAKEVECVADYVKMVADNLQEPEIKLVAATLVEQAQKADIAIPLAVAVVKAQSNFNPTFIGKQGQRGLMALSSAGLNADGKRKLHNMTYNLSTGLTALGNHIKGADTWNLALSNYCGHHDNVNAAFVEDVAFAMLNYQRHKDVFLADWLAKAKTGDYISAAVTKMKETAQAAAEKAAAEAKAAKEAPKKPAVATTEVPK